MAMKKIIGHSKSLELGGEVEDIAFIYDANQTTNLGFTQG